MPKEFIIDGGVYPKRGLGQMARDALDPEKNRLYEKAAGLHPFHWERLDARDPKDAAVASGAEYADGRFVLNVAGGKLMVDPVSRSVSFIDAPDSDPGYQRALIAVSYLAGALDAPEAGRFVPPRELPGGNSFFRPPHAPPDALIEDAFGRDPVQLSLAAARLGGEISVEGDGSAVLRSLPKIPVKIVLWAGDAEMKPSAVFLVDARSHLHLPLDVLWALLNVTASSLVRAAR